MITNTTEFDRANEEIRDLEERLRRLQETNRIGSKGFTNAGIRVLPANRVPIYPSVDG